METSIAKIAKHELLNTRICDLPLQINGLLEGCIKKLDRELTKKGLRFRPDYYFGESWGCVNKTISIEIPFFMATAELRHIERKYSERECENKRGLLRTLRHEYGHALNYAFELYREKEWRRLFGDFEQKYHELYMANPFSKRYVKYLEDYYAQKHPDEDWAETFAVWLDPGSNWRELYQRTPAMRKLAYVREVVHAIRYQVHKVDRIGRDEPFEEVDTTIAEYYGIDPEVIFKEKLSEYLEDLRRIFVPAVRSGRRIKASQFIRRCTPVIVSKVGEWIAGSNRHTIRKYLRRLEAISRHYDLRLSQREMLEKLVELTTLVNFYVMDEIHGLSS
ncbi:MAG: putative zinc-binding metallopeptidase [Acidobacteria bacterium]|nr:putative zinc-binding metallopeptidase [Acidobacteriota bacterium]MBI3657425.1 putative zinc-binding metallopeptidase [Acidobacteriota bacterium]